MTSHLLTKHKKYYIILKRDDYTFEEFSDRLSTSRVLEGSA